jgi:phosphoglycerate-specific signal transduction histidine kinase
MSITPNPPARSNELSGLLHQLAEPLTALVSYAAAAQRLCKTEGGHDDARLVDILAKISAQARRASEIVRLLGQLPLTGEWPHGGAGGA